LAKPNYDFAKRQRELSKAQKKEAKRLKKLADKEVPDKVADPNAAPAPDAADKPAVE